MWGRRFTGRGGRRSHCSKPQYVRLRAKFKASRRASMFSTMVASSNRHRGGAGCLGQSSTDALGFDEVVGLSKASGVDESEAETFDGARVLHRVSGGSGNVRDNGPVVPKKGVEERGFASVGCTNDGDRDAFFHGVPRGKTVCKATHAFQEVCKQCIEPFAVRELQSSSAKSSSSSRRPAKPMRASRRARILGQSSAELVHGQFVGPGVPPPEIGNGLGLGEVQSAIQKARCVNSPGLTASASIKARMTVG